MTDSAMRSSASARFDSDALSILARLVSFDTISANSNLALIEFVQHYLQHFGVDSTLIHDEKQAKANLFATIGPTDRPGIILSGHTDVVPVAGQDWSSDPFVLDIRNQRCFGRGTTDMKGFLACCLAAVPRMQEHPLQTPIHLAFSYDEEVGCVGVRPLLDFIKEQPVKPAFAIIGEPTLMAPVIGHKGKLAYRVLVTGHAGHSAYTNEGVNAVEYAARLISHINRLQRDKAAEGPFDQHYRVPHTTLHVGRIEGGTALNIIPQTCVFDFEIRSLPSEDLEQLLLSIQQQVEQLKHEMQQTESSCDITLTQSIEYPGLNTAEESSAVRFVRTLLESNQPLQKVSFGTEAGLFDDRLGIPAVVCGPGSIEQAHKPDEFVSLRELDLCQSFLHRLIECCQQELAI